MASKCAGSPSLPSLASSASAPALNASSTAAKRAQTAGSPWSAAEDALRAPALKADARSQWAAGSTWTSGFGARHDLAKRDARATYIEPSKHVPWKQFYVTVKAGTKTLADRLADRERDSDYDRELGLEWPMPSRAGRPALGGRAAEMLRKTEEVQALFSPAPLQDKPLKLKTDQAAPTGSQKSVAKVVQKPTAPSSLIITKGCRLAQLIESGCIGLVRSSYFEDCMLHNRPFAMRQLIPNSFMWRGDEAVTSWWKHGKCFACIVSYAWLSRDHPDPHQLHLKKLVRILEEYKRIWNMHEVAVILDYCSLWQRTARFDTRTSEQKEQFQYGFEEINIAYAHKAITSIKLTEVPKEEVRKYDDRGWTLLESILIDSNGGDWNRWTFGDFDPESREWADSVVFFMQAKCAKLRPPLTPKGFVKELDQRRARLRARDLPLFSNERDNEAVPKRYEEIFMQLIHSSRLVYDNADWSDEDVALLVEVLADCDRLEKLLLNNNRINLDGASRLAKLIPQLPTLNYLGLKNNPLCRDSQATDLLKLVWVKEKKPIRNLLL